ncbi:hypothetical protein K474DRAFT_1712839 [Panus rudis PR-1116 ss-1]|nr:hypothetical protein K474DRAFT_1712839 [Panus rudis PR-1116 ss-1]
MSYACPDCQKVFFSIHDLGTHLRQWAHGIKCPNCNKKPFATIAARDAHWKALHGYCDKCQSGRPSKWDSFTTVQELQAHKQEVHALIRCSLCESNIEKSALEAHYFESSKHPKCKKCSKGFESTAAYHAHAFAMHPEECCSLCKVPVEDLDVHYRQSANHPNCTKCERGFLNKERLDAHTLSQHPPPPPPPKPVVAALSSAPSSATAKLTCVPCARVFKNVVALQQHLDNLKAHPKCGTCKRGFMYASQKEEHMSSEHPNLVPPAPQPVVEEAKSSAAPTPHPETQPREFSPIIVESETSAAPSSPQVILETPKSTIVDLRRSSDEPEATPTISRGTLPRSSSEPMQSSLSVRIETQPIPENGNDNSNMISAITEATIITQASAPTSPALSSHSLSYAPSTPSVVSDHSPSISTSSLVNAVRPLSGSVAPLMDPDTPRLSVRSPSMSATSFMNVARASADPPLYESVSTIPPMNLDSPRVSLRSWETVEYERISLHSPHSELTPTLPPPIPYATRPKLTDREATPGASGAGAFEASLRSESTQSSNARSSTRVSPTVNYDKELRWHCRICLKDPAEPTVTICGHLFCHGCIVQELASGMQCPVCKKVMLLRLHLGAEKPIY